MSQKSLLVELFVEELPPKALNRLGTAYASGTGGPADPARAFAIYRRAADAGSVTAAADRLYLTQPAVSAALRRLRQAVGAPLFARQGRGQGRLAFERGETPIDYQTSSAYTSQVLPLVREGKAAPLFSYGILNAAGDIVRDPNFPDLPTFPEFLKAATGQDPSGPAWEAYRTLFVAGFAAQKFVVVPKETPKPVQDYLVPAIHQYYNDKPQAQRDEAMRSCGMAAMNLMLYAKSMGYDTCPMDGFDFDKVSELLNLPSDHTPAMFVCVGKGIKEAMPRGGQLPLDEVVIQNQFK